MSQRNYFEHAREVNDRVSASRYPWRSLGENLAGGDRSVADAVAAWLDSPPHCENLMDGRFEDVAVACSAQSGSDRGTYWTIVLGRK